MLIYEMTGPCSLCLVGIIELSAKLIANAMLRKEQRPAKKHENELIFLNSGFYFLMYV